MHAPRLLACLAFGQLAGILFADRFADPLAEFLADRLADSGAPLFAPRPPIAVGSLAAALAVAALATRRSSIGLRAALGGALVAAAIHCDQFAAAEFDRARVDDAAHSFDACIESAERRARGARYVVAGIRASDSTTPLPRRAEWFPSQPGLDARAGDCFRMRGKFRSIRSFANPGGSDRARAKARRGLGVRLRLVGDRWIVRTRRATRSPRWQLDEFRERIAARLAAHGRAGGLLAALSLGDRRALDPADREAFARLGIAHALAVSGLHLMLVAGLAFGMARAALRSAARRGARIDVRSWSLGAAAAIATLYALLSGPGVAALRAWVVVVAAAAGFALGRPGSLRAGFWLAAVLLLGCDPAAAFDLGAQLSFAATGALLYASPRAGLESGARAREEEAGAGAALARFLTWARDAVRASASAIAATTPLLASAGLEVVPLGLVANLVAIPWVGGVLLPVSLLAAAVAALPSAIGSWIGASRWLDLASAVARVSLDAVAGAAAWLPSLAEARRPGLQFALLGAALAGLAIRAASTGARVGLCLLSIAAVRVLPAPLAGAPVDAPATFIALDVGSGDALLLRSGASAVLVDAGLALPPGGPAGGAGYDLGKREVLPALHALGVRRLDLVVATHADADHAGGLPAVLRSLPAAELWLPIGAARDPGFGPLLVAAREQRVEVREVGQGTPLRRLAPGFELEVLWPPRASVNSGYGGARRNDASIVLRARLGGMRVLLAGDLGERAERRLLRSGVDIAADVLKVGHHGSASSSSSRWLERIAPSVAVISARCGRAGLPSPRSIQRLRASGAALWWTGAHGAVTITSSRSQRFARPPPLWVGARRLEPDFAGPRGDRGCRPR